MRAHQTNSSIHNVISAVDVNAIASDKPGPHHEPGIALVNVHYALAVKLPVILRPIQFLSGEQSGAQKKAIRLK